MKTMKMNFLFVLLLTGFAIVANGQSSSEWQMVLNKDHAALKVKMVNNDMTFCFNPATDSLTFSLGNKKAIKGGFFVEVVLKNNNKVIYTSSDKNLNSDKTAISVYMGDVYSGLKSIKVPSKPKYVLSIKDKTIVKEKILFEFAE
ncbi:MAG: hypothetical protein WCK09_14805 [Bacteroidota bacterium]